MGSTLWPTPSARSARKVDRPGKVNLRDYDFENPRLKLDSTSQGDEAPEQALEVYVYPGRFADPSDGDRYAKVSSTPSVPAARSCTVSRAVSAFTQATPSSLHNHPYPPLNREYLVLEVRTVFEARRLSGPEPDETARYARRVAAIPTPRTTYMPPASPEPIVSRRPACDHNGGARQGDPPETSLGA